VEIGQMNDPTTHRENQASHKWLLPKAKQRNSAKASLMISLQAKETNGTNEIDFINKSKMWYK
jgi:hypothetical protein